MRKLTFAAVLLLFAFALAAPVLAQDSDYDVEGWKKRVASPTYGLVVGFLTIKDWDGNEFDTLAIPGIELRIFNGTNVAKRGGFFVGYEVGTIFFVKDDFDTYTLPTSGPPVDLTPNEFFAGTLFLLSKYGYRLDLGIEAAGLSLGVEAGMGLQVSMGGIDIQADDGSPDPPETWIQIYAPFSLVLDAAAEAAFRLGQNFRVFGRLGVMVMPGLVEWGTDDINYPSAEPSNGFTGEMSPANVNFRLGFALNY